MVISSRQRQEQTVSMLVMVINMKVELEEEAEVEAEVEEEVEEEAEVGMEAGKVEMPTTVTATRCDKDHETFVVAPALDRQEIFWQMVYCTRQQV